MSIAVIQKQHVKTHRRLKELEHSAHPLLQLGPDVLLECGQVVSQEGLDNNGRVVPVGLVCGMVGRLIGW